jgi:hypothetical protein
MHRLLFFALIGLAAPAHAQDAPTDAQRAFLVAGGATGGVALVAVVWPLAAWEPGVWATAAALPVGAAVGTHLAGRLVGLEDAFAPTLGRSTAGALAGFGCAVVVGAAVAKTARALGSDEGCGFICPSEALGAGIGAGLLVVTPAVFAAHGYGAAAAPAALRTPTGETALGATVSLTL